MTRPIDRWKRATAGAPSRLLKPKYRKPHVARGPEGAPVLNNNSRVMMIAGMHAFGDATCKCGTIVCSKRGPCAPVVAAPKPSPAPVVERQAHRFVVGQRVRYIAAIACGHIPAGVVTRLWSDREVWWKDDDGTERSTLVKHLEPVEPLTAERGAQEP